MIPLLIFYLHIVFVAALFTRRWQEEGRGEGILAVFFAALIFFVGWSMTSFITRLFITEQTEGVLNSDSTSLLLLTVIEAVFYRFYLREERKKGQAERINGGRN